MQKLFSKINILNIFLCSRKGLLIGISIIVIISSIFYIRSRKIDFTNTIQSRRDASGFEFDYAKQFIYFYYYTGNFPLATQNNQLIYSERGAASEINNHGDKLIMEYKHWSRLGESARIFTFLPNAWLKGSPADPSINLFNSLFFVLGLLVLFRGLWKIKAPFIGLLACLVILFTPYYQYEVFTNENIFGLMHSIFFIVMGIFLPYFFSLNNNFIKVFLSGIIAVVFIAFCSEIRNEISIVLLSLLLIIILIPSLNLFKKGIILLLVVLSFVGLKKGIHSWFDYKFNETTALVKSKGGHVYTGGRIAGHQIWHNVFCGLGDYDNKYNHAWDDRTGYKFALPILKKDYNIDVPYSGKYQTDLFYDSAKLYYIKFDEILPYETIMKNEVLHLIKEDPMWYAQILFKRCLAILKTTLPFPNLGWLMFPLLIFLWYKKEWTYIKLIIVSLPLSAVSLLIYSGRGATYNSIYAFVVLFILIAMVFKYFTEIQNKIIRK